VSLDTRNRKPGRRAFLKSAAVGLAGTVVTDSALPRSSQSPQKVFQRNNWPEMKSVAWLPPNATRTWLGPPFWANRLQDWRLHQGRIECLTGASGHEVRTAAVLTREIVQTGNAAYCCVRTGVLQAAGKGGFSGLLIGGGGGKLDYRAAALIQRASGIGGGILCVYESDGQVRFREHTDETTPLVFDELAAEKVAGTAVSGRSPKEDVELRLEIVASPDKGRYLLRLSAWSAASGTFLGGAIRQEVEEKEILGGIALVSSPFGKGPGWRFWFSDLRVGGDKVAHHPERALGPILGTLYSLNGNLLKLSAQFLPVAPEASRTVKLEYRTGGFAWQESQLAEIGDGYTALFRITNWDSARDWEYRIVYPAHSIESEYYSGKIPKDPADREFINIGLFSCSATTGRSLEGGIGEPELPRAELLGRYTSENLYFPHRELVAHATQHDLDLLFFVGDQLYENSPTARDESVSPTLDYLYKWYLWLWSFRDLTRNKPAIVMTDDHDVYHGNLWGNGGRAAPHHDQNQGGYVCSAEWVNLVQRTQCGHNPDPYDPSPIDQGITVYYGAFQFGGVSFAILEDRKFKTAAIQGEDLDVHVAELLGERQEKFLEVWARDWQGASAKICVTQTLFACLQTSPAGRPLLDFDSNGYPKLARDRAIELLREAQALVLSGDQHLATVARHGIDGFTDGVLQFTGPAVGATWVRWFEPAKPLANAAAQPHTGDFIDAFGNKVRVLAVANPKISFREYRKYKTGRDQVIWDRKLKSSGYGVVRANKKIREYVIECWPGEVDPSNPNAQQFPGWPVRLRFDDCDGRKL